MILVVVLQRVTDYLKIHLILNIQVFSPQETIDNPLLLHLIFCQIVQDCFSSTCIRLTNEEKMKLQSKVQSSGINADNILNSNPKISLQKSVIEMARDMPTYFCRLYPVSGGRNLPNVHYIGVSHSGVRLIQRERDAICDYLKVLDRLRSAFDLYCSLTFLIKFNSNLQFGRYLRSYYSEQLYASDLVVRRGLDHTLHTQSISSYFSFHFRSFIE